MKTRSKVLLLIVSALALVIATIFGTLAYLTDEDVVTNTFTVGNVGISLDEADVNDAGEPLKDGNTTISGENGDSITVTRETADRVKENTYHLVPGHVYVKDPTVKVAAESEEAYVRMVVKVERIDQLKEALSQEQYYADDGNGNKIFLLENLLNGTWNRDYWIYKGYNLDTDGTTGIYEFRYYDVDNNSETVGSWHSTADAIPLKPLFTEIKIPGADIDNENLAKLKNVKIVVNAHAIQADGFDDADAAWGAFTN